MKPGHIPGQVLIGLLTCAARVVSAQGELIAPVPTSQSIPPLPTNVAGNTVEGWAIVRYSVLSDGSTDNVSVIAMAPPGADDSATIDTVEQWTFDPATQDGEPIDWHNNETVITFRDDGESVSTSPEWVGIFESVEQILEEKVPEYDLTEEEDYQPFREALTLNRSLRDEHARHYREVGLTLLQAALINLVLEERHSAYDFARLATHPAVTALTGEDLFVALQVRWQLEVDLGRTADALMTHERIAAGFSPDDPIPSAAVAEELEMLRTTEEFLPILGFVADHPWRIDASRRTFTIANVDGSVDFIQAECQTSRLRVDYQPDVEWLLPDSFGDCTLFVHGDPGTSFSSYELLPAEE